MNIGGWPRAMVPHLHHHRPLTHQPTPSPLAHSPRPTTIRNATTTTTTTPPCWQFSDTLAFVWFTGVSKTVKVINLKLRCRWKEILAKAVIFFQIQWRQSIALLSKQKPPSNLQLGTAPHADSLAIPQMITSPSPSRLIHPILRKPTSHRASLGATRPYRL